MTVQTLAGKNVLEFDVDKESKYEELNNGLSTKKLKKISKNYGLIDDPCNQRGVRSPLKIKNIFK